MEIQEPEANAPRLIRGEPHGRPSWRHSGPARTDQRKPTAKLRWPARPPSAACSGVILVQARLINQQQLGVGARRTVRRPLPSHPAAGDQSASWCGLIPESFARSRQAAPVELEGPLAHAGDGRARRHRNDLRGRADHRLSRRPRGRDAARRASGARPRLRRTHRRPPDDRRHEDGRAGGLGQSGAEASPESRLGGRRIARGAAGAVDPDGRHQRRRERHPSRAARRPKCASATASTASCSR